MFTGNSFLFIRGENNVYAFAKTVNDFAALNEIILPLLMQSNCCLWWIYCYVKNQTCLWTMNLEHFCTVSNELFTLSALRWYQYLFKCTCTKLYLNTIELRGVMAHCKWVSKLSFTQLLKMCLWRRTLNTSTSVPKTQELKNHCLISKHQPLYYVFHIYSIALNCT